MISKEEEIFHHFKLPIEYLVEKKSIQSDLNDDLELTVTKDPSQQPIYHSIFQPKTELGEKAIIPWSKYFTTNTRFLEESHTLYSTYDANIDTTLVDLMIDKWNTIKNHTNFLEKYNFVEWAPFQFLNNSSLFMTLLSYYSISSPILNLAFPILILIIPFFLLKIAKIPITFNNYKNIIMKQLQNHIIGKFWKNFKTTNWNQRTYYIISISLYFYGIYQNILSCYKFYINSREITQQFITISSYLSYTIKKMDELKKHMKEFQTYHKFKQTLIHHREILNKFYQNIKNLPIENISPKKVTMIGYILTQFHAFYNDNQLEKSFLFSFGFHGYLDTILGINQNLTNGYIHATTFVQKNYPIANFKQIYYPALLDKDPVKNDIDMKTNKIITGPNAAGKTTIIKSTLLNILFSQQIGCGFFQTATITPFDFIHTYINIPDTIARDSLFQAEAKKCKEILNLIKKNKDKKHLCIFDELYSGTNPYEAISSAYSYLKYISKYKNVRFLLTTHFIKLCNLVDKHKKITNYHMDTKIIPRKKPIYTYQLKKGISSIKGGIYVLKDLKYPRKILRTTEKILRSL